MLGQGSAEEKVEWKVERLGGGCMHSHEVGFNRRCPFEKNPVVTIHPIPPFEAL